MRCIKEKKRFFSFEVTRGYNSIDCIVSEAAVHMENKLWYFCDAQKLQAYNKTTHDMYALVTIYKYRNL